MFTQEEAEKRKDEFKEFIGQGDLGFSMFKQSYFNWLDANTELTFPCPVCGKEMDWIQYNKKTGWCYCTHVDCVGIVTRIRTPEEISEALNE